MAVGQNALTSFLSYLGVGRETTFGTAVTATAGLEFMSCGLKTMREKKVIEEIATSRVYGDNIALGKKVEGDLEFCFDPRATAAAYLLQNALGGTAITSATATGETAGGTAFTHTFTLGNFDTTHASLSVAMRKGDSASAKLFEYTGVRVNEMTLNAELDEPVKMTLGLIGKDSTIGSTDFASTVGDSLNQWPLSFASGRLSVESSFASLTSTSFWHIQSCELVVSNNLKADSESRRIGSEVLQVLPPGIANITLNMTLRFDTTTAYSAMLNNTQLSAELEFLGDTLTTSSIRRGIKIQLPKVFINDAPDPEIGGPDEILTTEVSCVVLRDTSSAAGYAIRALVTNNTSAY